MAFAVTARTRMSIGNLMGELVTFTELNTDTGGTFVTTLATVLGVHTTGNTSAGMGGSFSGTTITVTNVAGPTGGSVLVIGLG